MYQAGPAGLGAPEIIIICLVLLVLFGAKKLPDFARGTGRALRIFKSETKGLMDDDDDQPSTSTAPPQQIHQAPSPVAPPPVAPPPPTPQQTEPRVQGDQRSADTER